jgi:hypothetical protein
VSSDLATSTPTALPLFAIGLGAFGSARLAEEEETCAPRCVTKTSNSIKRPPGGGLSVCAVAYPRMSAIGT